MAQLASIWPDRGSPALPMSACMVAPSYPRCGSLTYMYSYTKAPLPVGGLGYRRRRQILGAANFEEKKEKPLLITT